MSTSRKTRRLAEEIAYSIANYLKVNDQGRVEMCKFLALDQIENYLPGILHEEMHVLSLELALEKETLREDADVTTRREL